MKRISIRTKLFFWSLSLILMFMLLFALFSAFLFKSYYIFRHKLHMQEHCELLARLYDEDNSEIYDEIQRIEALDGFSIEIFSAMGKLKYISGQGETQGFRKGMHDHIPPPPPETGFRFSDFDRLLEDRAYLFQQHYDQNFKTRIIHIYYRMENGGIIHLNNPLEPIEQSVVIAMQFNLFSGILALCFAVLLSYFIARVITTPLKRLTGIAKSMASLDFSQKYVDTSQDEIGELGQNLNSLSDQLNRSIEELNRMNHSLLDEVERKRQIDRMRKDFIASVSHELRTPLALIRGYAEGLQDSVTEDNREYYCEVILDETQKMEKHVGGLLNLSQLQSGALSFEIHNFDIVKLLLDIADKYRKRFNEKGVSFDFHYAASIMVSADRDRTEQIIINYLNNALNHINGKRTIAIIISRTETGKVRINISNSGPRIPEASLEKIWDSYYKVDKARTRSYGGTGLGLSIVKAIQEQYGNGYGVRNRSDGVIFWFELNPA